MSRMRTKATDRFLAALLSILMVFTMIPMTTLTAFAATSSVSFKIKDTSTTEGVAGAKITIVNSELSIEESGITDSNGYLSLGVDTRETDPSSITVDYTIEKEGYTTKTGTTELGTMVDTWFSPVPVTETFTVAVAVTGDATVKLNGVEQTSIEVDEGTQVEVEIIPAEGSYLSEVKNGTEPQTLPEKGQAFETTVTADSDIVFTVKTTKEFTVSKDSATYTGGTVKLNGGDAQSVTVDEGANVPLVVEAESGYQIASVTIDGAPQTIDNVTKFEKSITVTKDIAIVVAFVKVYTVKVEYDSTNGEVTATPSLSGGEVTVETGTNVTITADPKDNWRVESVKINGNDATGGTDDAMIGVNFGASQVYTKELTAENDYTVVITFAPNTFNITTGTDEHGSYSAVNGTVNYDGSTTINVTPADGWTVDKAQVNGADATVIKDDSGIYFVIDHIVVDQSVVVTFKEKSPAEASDYAIDDTAALREDTGLYVIKSGDAIVFSTVKEGIALYNGDVLVAGGVGTKSVSVDANQVITKVAVYYQAAEELYADWHEIACDVEVVVDTTKPTAELTPDPLANSNGYHNSDITFAVTASDVGVYSGLATVEYWITKDTVDGTKTEFVLDGNAIKADANTFVVSASVYNSADVKVNVRVVDKAGNEETFTKELKVNSTNPTVSLDITGTKFDNAEDGYYNDKRELTITIVDRADTFSKANVAAGLKIKRDGQDVVVEAGDIVWSDNDSLHIGKYVFNDDGHYEWSISYENLAGLSNTGVTAPSDKFIYDFYVDKAEPYNLKVTYEPTFVDVVLETITFGFYKAPVNVTIEAVDDTAEIAQFEYEYTGANGTVVSGASIHRDGTRAYAEFTIPAEFRGNVSFSATDKAGRTTELSDERVVVIDTIAPGITVEWAPKDSEAYNSKYFDASRTATIKVDEANFFAADVEDGLLVITQTMVTNDGTQYKTNLKPEFTKVDDVYVATVTFDQDADYTFDIKYTDRSGNVYDEYPEDKFTIDTIKPVINVAFDNNVAVNDDQFKAARKATITVVEHNFVATGMVVTVNGDDYPVEWKPVEGQDDTYYAEVPFPGDAHYTFAVNGKDFVNNANDGVNEAVGTVAPWEFTVDASGPSDLTISYEPTFMGTLLENLTFGFYDAPVKVTISATDDTAGIDYFTYSYIVQDGASTINVGAKDVKVDVDGVTASTSFEIPAQFRGFVSFTATNNSGVSSSQADTNVVVVDTIAPGVTVEYKNNTVANDRYYSAKRTATIRIDEANFFAEDIEAGLLVITRKTVLNDGTTNVETLEPVFTKDGNSDTYTATVDFDKDADYTFDIKYTDRSGNKFDSYEIDVFTVDMIKPVISIEKANGAYFDANRTAKITVVEHNFRASDFVFTAEAYSVLGNAEANKIVLSSKAYQTYLQNQENWTEVAADTWEIELTFDIEGNYVIGATYTDLAGNEQEEAISDTFCIDKSKPENLKITYEPDFVDVVLEAITFGFYKAPVKVTIEATDDFAGVDYFVYSYLVEAGASATNTGMSNVQAVAVRDGSTNRWYATFDIPAQFRGNVSFTAYDKATNSEFLADENAVIVDNVAPGVNVVYDNHNDFDDNYFMADRTATITITEANFFGAADLDDEFLVITVGKTLNDGTYTSTKMKPEFTKNGDIYTATILFDEDADYTFDIKYTDRSGNVYDSYEMDEFTIDKIKPVIDVSYDDDVALYENGNQFRTNRVATIRITEHNFNAANVVAKVMASGSEVTSYAEYLKNPDSWTQNGDVYTATITYSDEAHYTFEIGYTDMAGNTNNGVNYGDSVAPTAFTVDKSAPTGMDIQIDNTTVVGSMTTLEFNKFYGAAVTVKLSANCDISGLQSLKYQKVANESDYNENGTWTAYDDETGVVVSPSEKFVLYFRAEDRAGNVNIIRTTGIVVDNQKPTGETKAPEIDILPATPNANGIHNGDVNVDLKVVDPKYTGAEASANGHYSGLKKITYKIYTTDTDAVEEGTLFELGSLTTGVEFDADNLAKSWAGSITIDSAKFNSNNVIVEVTATDNAGNTRTTKTVAGDIKIDIIAPTIDVTYDNNTPDSVSFYKDNRTATIVVTERNFRPEDVQFTITRDGETFPVSCTWTMTEGTGNLDDRKWTATVSFTTDGDYEFAVEYTDLAGWKCEKSAVNYGDSVTPTAFTIDHINPEVVVTYDNIDALNDHYYKADRTATIIITEHNFDASRVTITLKATDDGVEATLPTVSGWTSNGDKHTATIHYGNDSLYSFDIAIVDKAGRNSTDFAEQTFYVDKTNPTVSISGIVDESANNDEGNIGFVITATDTNFDVFTPVLTAVIKNGDKFETKTLDIAKVTDTKNGKVYTVTNIDADGIYRITCTVVDKAGNAFSSVTLDKADGTTHSVERAGTDTLVIFSVNRDGSTFEIDGETVKVVDQYYIQNLKNDVVIVETNADPLKEYTVTLNGKELVKDTDYTVTEEGGNGAWMKYTYTVKKDLFADEGEYKLVVSSKDKAENDAFSDVKDATVEFVVDRTAPVVTVSGLANDGRYQTESQIVTLIPTDDGGALKTVVVKLVDEDGKVIKELVNLSGEALTAALEENGGKITFEVAEGLYQNVQVVCTDEATGDGEGTNTYDVTFKNVSVSSNVFMIFWANKPLRWGTIGGVSALLIGLVVFIVLKKKKRKEA